MTPLNHPVLQSIATTRSIRRYAFDPLPESDLNAILWTAIRAPSGTNRQPFRFLVLRDGERATAAKSLLGHAFRRGWSAKCASEGWQIQTAANEHAPQSRRERTLAAMQFFVEHFERIPVVVLACYVRYRPPHHAEGASIFPACQNLLLAARALGYGACFSGWHVIVERELRELFEIPDGVELSLTITLGRPLGEHGPVRRKPIADLVFEEAWGVAPAWAEDPPGARLARGGPTSK